MNRVVERLIVSVGAVVDQTGARAALQWYGSLSAAAATAAAAVAGLAVATASELDAQAKAARSAGVSVQTYTELTYALDRQGVSAEQTGAALRGLGARLAAIGSGSQDAAKPFYRLGVSVRDASGHLRTAGDVLPDLLAALSRQSEGDRLATSMLVLGEAGGAMATALAGGSAEIDRLQRRAHDLRLVVDDTAVAAGERLTDSMTDLRASVRGVALQVGTALIPGVTAAVDALTQMIVASDGIVGIGLDRVIRGIGVAMDFAATPAGKAATSVGALTVAIGAVRAGTGLVSAVTAASPALAALAAPIGAAASAAAPLIIAVAAVALALDDLYVASQGGESITLSLATALGVEEETVALLSGAVGVLTSAWEAAGAVMAGIGPIAGAIGGAISSVAARVAELVPGLQSVVDLISSIASSTVGGLIGSFASAAEGFGELARYAAGDQSVVLAEQDPQADAGRALLSSVLPGGVIGSLGDAATVLAASARSEALGTDLGSEVRAVLDRDATVVSGRQTVAAGQRAVQVTVDATIDARRAASDAGREVERQVYAALSTVEALP